MFLPDTKKKRTKRKEKKCEKGKKMVTLWGDGNVNYLIEVIIVHRIHIWQHQAIHLTYGQFLAVKYILRSCLKKDDWTLGGHGPGCSTPGGSCGAVQKFKKKKKKKKRMTESCLYTGSASRPRINVLVTYWFMKYN